MKKLLWLVLTYGLWANDGGYTMSGNHLIPIFESNISITKEILTIKREKGRILDVTVEYTFFNPFKEKNILVGFEAAKPRGDIDPFSHNGQHPYMKDFSVLFNEKKLPYTVIEYSKNYVNTMKHYMKNKGSPSRDLVKNKSSDIYNPDIGYVYYFDAKFSEGNNSIVHHYKYVTSYLVAMNFQLSYILTAAKRWANKQIDDFTLVLDMGGYTDFFIVKSFFKDNKDWTMDGLMVDTEYDLERNISQFYLHNGVVKFHKKNFKIEGELELYSDNVYPKVDFFMDVFDHTKHTLSFMQDKVNINSYVAKDKLSDKILHNLPYARRGYVSPDKRIQKYYETLEWYRKRPAYKAKKSDWTEKEKEFNLLMQKQKLHILRNLPYARRGHAFKNERLKSFFEAQPWYHKNEYKADGTLELSPTEKKWLKKIESMDKEDTITFYTLMDEYEALILQIR